MQLKIHFSFKTIIALFSQTISTTIPILLPFRSPLDFLSIVFLITDLLSASPYFYHAVIMSGCLLAFESKSNVNLIIVGNKFVLFASSLTNLCTFSPSASLSVH